MSHCVSTKTSFEPSIWEWCDMRIGYSYAKSAVFTDGNEVAINIVADTFTMAIKNSLGATVQTLSIGSGLTIISPNTLVITVGTPTTVTAGVYNGLLIWTRTGTGSVAPVISFTFTVE